MLEDVKKVKYMLVASLLIKIIEQLAREQDVFSQHIVSTCYTMLEAVKNQLQGEDLVLDDNISSKYDIIDDEEEEETV